MNTMTQELLKAIAVQYPDRSSCEFSPKEILHVSRALGFEDNATYKYITSQPKVNRGIYKLEALVMPFNKKETQTMSVPQVVSIVNNDIFVPQKDESFVAWGHCKDLSMIVQSKSFYPVYITGLSGNGKTFSVEQACAALKRELIRVNITIETDADDLLGGFRLVNGETVWHNGPVVEAMQRGAILLLDEIDLASNKIMCLQSVLEGKGVFLKKIGMNVVPKAGFNIFATANTKGKGSDDGRFIGTNVLNEAFLERFPITFEQQYPTIAFETKILTKTAESLKIPMVGEHTDFIKHLCSWSDIIRKTFADGGIDEVISTRRLVHIIKSYSIFGKKDKAIKVCLNRFDDETKQTFVELYDKIDAEFNQSNTVEG